MAQTINSLPLFSSSLSFPSPEHRSIVAPNRPGGCYTSPRPRDSLKNPVSEAMNVSPITALRLTRNDKKTLSEPY